MKEGREEFIKNCKYPLFTQAQLKKMLCSSSEKVADAIAKLLGIVKESHPEPEIKQKVQA